MTELFVIFAWGILLSVFAVFQIERAEKSFLAQLESFREDTNIRHKQAFTSIQKWCAELERVEKAFYELGMKNHLSQKMATEKLASEYDFLKVHVASIDKKTHAPPLIKVELVNGNPRAGCKVSSPQKPNPKKPAATPQKTQKVAPRARTF